jgi:chondroitin 4-sulfotransferase 11
MYKAFLEKAARGFYKLSGTKPLPLHTLNGKPFVFIHINKTGGTSINRAVGILLKQHLTAEEIVAAIGRERWGAAFKVAFVRNPWDKVASHYRYRIKTAQTGLGVEDTLTFKEWVQAAYQEKDPYYYDIPKMFAPQLDWISVDGEIDCDFIGKFENLNADFERLMGEFGVEIELQHLNKTVKRDYREYYDPETRDIIGNVFKKDADYFGYTFDD